MSRGREMAGQSFAFYNYCIYSYIFFRRENLWQVPAFWSPMTRSDYIRLNQCRINVISSGLHRPTVGSPARGPLGRPPRAALALLSARVLVALSIKRKRRIRQEASIIPSISSPQKRATEKLFVLFLSSTSRLIGSHPMPPYSSRDTVIT